MAVPGPGYAITARVEAPASATAAGDLAVAVGRVGGVMTAFDVVESRAESMIVDISCNALSETARRGDHRGPRTRSTACGCATSPTGRSSCTSAGRSR